MRIASPSRPRWHSRRAARAGLLLTCVAFLVRTCDKRGPRGPRGTHHSCRAQFITEMPSEIRGGAQRRVGPRAVRGVAVGAHEVAVEHLVDRAQAMVEPVPVTAG